MTLQLAYGDVIVTTNNETVRIAPKENKEKKFITLEQANELLRANQIELVSVDIEGEEVLMTIPEATAYLAE